MISAFAFASREPRGDRRRRRSRRRSGPELRRDARRRAMRSRPAATSAGRSRPRRPRRCRSTRALRPGGRPRRKARATSATAERRPRPARSPPPARRARPAAHLWTQFQARLSLPPVNQVAHSLPRDVSTTCSQGSENSRPRSSIRAGQKRSGSSTEMRWRSSYRSTPRRAREPGQVRALDVLGGRAPDEVGHARSVRVAARRRAGSVL